MSLSYSDPPTVFVTGGAGYVGSHACKALALAGFHPVTFDNLATGNRWAIGWGPLEFGDILDSSRLTAACKQHRPVAILHFAGSALVGESMVAPSVYYRNNVVGTHNLLEAARLLDIKLIIFSSTCATYGVPDRVPITDDAPQRPINPYGASKLMAERMLEDYDKAYGMRYATLRYFNAAGADPSGEIGECRTVETHLIPLMLDSVLGVRPPFCVLGTDYPTPDGTAIRDYIHVSDLADAHVLALRHLLAGNPSISCNLGTGVGYSVLDVLAAARSVIGREVPYTFGPRRQGDPPILVARADRASSKLGLSMARSTSIEQIIADAWSWHRRELRPG
jgi:UDP-glucose-4-epimerase GalE